MIFIGLLSSIINNLFVENYYLYAKKKSLDKIESIFKNNSKEDIINNINELEKENDITVVYTSSIGNIEEINSDIISQFEKKKIKLSKFWLTEETIERLADKSVNKIYNQEKSKFSLLTKYIMIDNSIFAIGISIPYLEETIHIINKFNLILLIISISSISVLVIVYSNRILRPIKRLNDLSKDIASLNFRTEKIITGDELQELAESINFMSESLMEAQERLTNQNNSLRFFISNVSHELKTPIALIKAYAQGIEDGLDDGEYLSIIIDETNNMNTLVEKLLYWIKIESVEIKTSEVNIIESIYSAINKFYIIIKENEVKVNIKFDKDDYYNILADKDSIDIVLNNIITNAIKYTENNKIDIELRRRGDLIILEVINGIKDDIKNDVNRIWDLFYVGDKSRCKNISGTGIGLSLVKIILEKHNFKYGAKVEGDNIRVYIEFKCRLS